MESALEKQIAKPKRLMSVDTLRGFDMLWIIGGGSIFQALSKAYPSDITNFLAMNFEHEWGKFYFYDLIMPLFLFIVGVVMPVAFTSRLKKGETKKKIYLHVFKRVFKLYILGLIASGNLLQMDINKLSLWTDTLHAIAVGYLVSSFLILELNTRWQIIIVSALLLLYWVSMTFMPIPGHGAGIFEQDLNLALYIDDKVLGQFQEGHGWTYILTNLTFICSVMLGAFAGKILLSSLPERTRLIRLVVIGLSCVVAGKIWGLSFPIIHHLWTSSMVLYSAGLSFLLLALFYYIVDIKGHQKWAFPFIVIGANAIAVYVATKIFDFKLIANVFLGGFEKWAGYEWYQFLLNVGSLLVIWLILYWMYKTKTFIKL